MGPHPLRGLARPPGHAPRSRRAQPLPLAWTILIASLALSLLPFAAWSMLWTRAKRHVQALALRLCPRCRYDLSASAPDGTCPECGRAYTDADLHRIWRAAYRIRADGPMTPSAR
ncbi:MAG: hypothetical protein IT436_01490 [Phycisphaerales bacterium]|nr:hypothetical protein [Phycisphaerales bacterium]